MQQYVSNIFGELTSALRFRWYGMAVAWLLCLIGWAWVLALPDVYEGRASVFIDTTSVLERTLKDQINVTEVANQFNYIREALLARPQLEAIIDLVEEDAFTMDASRREALIARLTRNISIRSSGAGRGQPDTIYNITYQHPDREMAQRVVSTLLDFFVRDTVGESRRSDENAVQFLEERVAEYEVRLAEAEEALAKFKRENADRLPGAEGDFYQRMRAESDALAQANRDLRLLLSKRAQLQSQIEAQRSVVPGIDGPTTDLPANSLDARIRDYQARLDLALLDLTEKHPDVIALRQTLEYLKAERDKQLAALGLEGSDVELYSLGTNPVRQALEIQLNDAQVQIATLQADIKDREARLNNLQGLINELPQVEAQLAQLNRDYDVVYEQYLALVRSRETQQLTRKAADSDQSDFRVIDPPTASVNPVGPPRLSLYAVVLLGGLAAGAAIAFLCAQIWPVFSSVRMVRTATGLPVLGAVSHAWYEKHRLEQRRATRNFINALVMLIAVFVVLVGLERFGLGSLVSGAV